jgi:predicted dehydrogenase
MVREARALRLSGALGPVHLIHGSYLQDWLLDPDATNWRVDPVLGGASRAFADIGSHWCDLVEWVSGERFVSVVSALSTTIADRAEGSGKTFSTAPDAAPAAPRQKVATEDVAAALFKTSNGVLANLTVSQVSAGRKNRLWFEIDGAEAAVSFDQEESERLWFATRDATVLKLRDPSQGSAEQRRLATLPAGHAQGYAQCFEAFVADTYATIAGEVRDGLPSFDDAVRTSHIVEAVLASHRTQSWQPIACENAAGDQQ